MFHIYSIQSEHNNFVLSISISFTFFFLSFFFFFGHSMRHCRRLMFNPWVGKIPWRRERLPTSAFWPGEFHGLYSPWGRKESDTTERLSLHFTTLASLPPENLARPLGLGQTASLSSHYSLQFPHSQTLDRPRPPPKKNNPEADGP